MDEFGDMIRFGLCCTFRDQPIKFRTTTAAALSRLPCRAQLTKLAELCMHNADALFAALQFCEAQGIGSFRISSSILPVKTHPAVGYGIGELPNADALVARFQHCGAFARENGLNVSAIAEDALRVARREAWKRENAQALEERKAWIEKNGLPLAQYQVLKI